MTKSISIHELELNIEEIIRGVETSRVHFVRNKTLIYAENPNKKSASSAFHLPLWAVQGSAS